MTAPALAPRLLSLAEAARYCGVSKETFLAHVRPQVGPVPIGARILWDRHALDRWLDAAGGFAASSPAGTGPAGSGAAAETAFDAWAKTRRAVSADDGSARRER